MRPLVPCLLVFLFAPPAFADDDAQDLSASIEVGRYGVMLDQAAQAEKLLVPAAAPVAAPDAPRDTLYESLVATVLRFNALSDQVCREVALPAADCAGPFRPAWLAAPPADQPQLRAMIDEAGAHIGSFWGDMCVLARVKDEHLCDIE